MNLNLTPVKVDISIESLTLNREAFYRVCFITDNDVAPRTIEIKTLGELLENGYTRESLAYNFCVGIFAQQSMSSVFIRSKRSNETYSQAYDSDNNEFNDIEKNKLSLLSTTSILNENSGLPLKFWTGTQSELDLVSPKDDFTLYLVTPSQ